MFVTNLAFPKGKNAVVFMYNIFSC